MKAIYDYVWSLLGWFSPTQALPGWFDVTLTTSGDAIDATAFPSGVEMVSAFGTSLAYGRFNEYGGGPKKLLPAKRDYKNWAELPPPPRVVVARPRAVDARTTVAGVAVSARIGRVSISGDSGAGCRGCQVVLSVGQVSATGVQNLTDEDLVFLIDEAA